MAQGGLKKPLNLLESPIYPDIKATLPRFRWSGKFWTVDTGETLIEYNNGIHPGLVESTVLVQNRDYNKQFAYGQSSHRDVVNQSFRPPLITRDDTLPLSRQPRKIVVPRINPGTADDTGGNVAFASQNETTNETTGFLTDRVKLGDWRPTHFADVLGPDDNSILPDLYYKVPQVSVTSGNNSQFKSRNIDETTISQNDSKKIDVPLINSPESFFTINAENPLENLDLPFKTTPLSINAGNNYDYKLPLHFENQDLILDKNTPEISVTSGIENFNFTTPFIQETQFDYNRPQVSSNSGFTSSYQIGITPIDMELDYVLPQTSVTSGVNSNNILGITPVDYKLNYTRPQVSVNSGRKSNPELISTNDQFKDASSPVLDEKITPINAIFNPSPQYTSFNSQINPIGILESAKNYSPDKSWYDITPTMLYKETNNRTSPHFKQKTHSLSKYNGSLNSSYIPKSGIQLLPVSLKSTQPHKKEYRF